MYSATTTSIRENLEQVRERIDAACLRAGRSSESVSLIGIAKTFSAEIVREAIEAGLTDIGENRVQELVEKREALEAATLAAPRWHFVGHLQRNKVRHLLAGDVTLVHSVDSARLARTIARISAEQGRATDCLIQINTSGEESKHGLPADELRELLEETADLDGLRIRGLMSIPAPVLDPEQVRPEFIALRRLAEKNSDIQEMEFLSMGMSGDYEVAIEEGATHIRVGTALFGLRPTCRIV